MNKKLKITLITLAVIIIVIVGAFQGLKAFVGSIHDQRSCEWANIDNIEMHAKLDIPKVIKSDCNYSEHTNTKMAYFELDSTALNTENYIQANGLTKMDDTSQVDSQKYLNLDKNFTGDLAFYFRKNSYQLENTYILLDTSSHKLWVTIEYED